MAGSPLPIKGFLGAGATFAADIDLVLQLTMGGALIMAMILAKYKRYKANGACQTTVLLSNLWLIGFECGLRSGNRVATHLPKVFYSRYCKIATIHAALVDCSDRRVGYLLCLVHSAVPIVVALTRWRRERNYRRALFPLQ